VTAVKMFLDSLRCETVLTNQVNLLSVGEGL